MDEEYNAKSICAYMESPIPAAHVHVFPRVTSTNDVAKDMAIAGAPAYTVVIADRQTGGKGRMGRQFYSPPASGIYLSMIIRPRFHEDQVLLLTTGIAVAACRAIEALCDAPVQIKWVNDLYLRGKKIAGILVEAVSQATGAFLGVDKDKGERHTPEQGNMGISHMILGIGVNVRLSDSGFPTELAEKAGALCEEGEGISRSQLAAALIDQLWGMLHEMEENPDSCAVGLVAEAKGRSCVLGKDI
ncbi:MAG: biotin--[acetyl-CoA-carboxylase] ligase, partial [Clostridiales bacterium]|nr:biotin--[acetyl-CoA-carboxylase] ligase [Clostridiales bacterium]